MNEKFKPITLKPCPKGWSGDLDKATTPARTIEYVQKRLAETGMDIFAGCRRVDAGRLGIPVYLGLCGSDARAVMPTRKQMGKGSSPEQARASALMEVMERFAFFSFWRDKRHMVRATFSEAEKLFGNALIDIGEISRSVGDSLDNAVARRVFDLCSWEFYPATNLGTGRIVWLPLDWFRMLGEFNGSSAGNTPEESLLQGLSELMERHVSCIVDRTRPVLATIDASASQDPVLQNLLAAFGGQGVRLVLKDISLGMPMPTVAALAWDPATFPDSSEIVFTAGTASSPAKAAIRAITEVAQLGGDFCTSSCYEASGLPKFTSLEQCGWLLDGPTASLASLPSVENADICQELKTALAALAPVNVYAVETTCPALGVPAHYCAAPGLEFRERDRNQCLGLFVGRKLAEEAAIETAAKGLDTLSQCFPGAHYLPFFRGLLALRQGDSGQAAGLFLKAAPAQPDDDSRAMALFYAGYAATLRQDWHAALPPLGEAAALCPQMKAYANLHGVSLFRTGDYAAAEACFDRALRLDKGSALDLANRGLCRELLGRKAEAVADFRAALAIDPDIAFAREHLEKLAPGDS